MSFDQTDNPEDLARVSFDPRDFHPVDLKNGTRSACRSQKLALRHETPAQYEALHKKWWDEYQPSGHIEETLIDLLIRNHWLFKRACLRREQVEWDMPMSATHWIERYEKKVEIFTRFKSTAERAFQRAFREVELHFRECVQAENMAHKSELMRLKIEAEIARKPEEVNRLLPKMATPLYRDRRDRAAARAQSVANSEIGAPESCDSSNRGLPLVDLDRHRENSSPPEEKPL